MSFHKKKEPYRDTAFRGHIEPKSIKCPNCSAKAFNDPNNLHLVSHGTVNKDGGFKQTEHRERRFQHYYFCTKCTRCTHHQTEV